MSRSSSKAAVSRFETIFAHNGIDLMLLALALAIVVNIALVMIRNVKYVVSAELDEVHKVLVLGVRQLRVRSFAEVRVPYDQFSWVEYQTLKLPGMNGYKGYEFRKEGRAVGFFLVDHFTWNDQTRKVSDFLEEMARRTRKKIESPAMLEQLKKV